jgi:branched-chain amino acid transport system substrate-binding protein
LRRWQDNMRDIAFRLRLLIGILCAVALVVAPKSGGAADPYEIYSISSLTGGLAFVGKTGSDALKAYEDYFNKSGGINGRPIHFVIEDAQTNPQLAVQLFNELGSKHLSFVMGPTSAAECNAVFAMVKSGPVAWCYSSAVNGQPGSFEFQTSATNYDYNSAALRWLRLRGLTRIALITPTDATGQTYDRAIDAILALPENKSLTLVDREHFSPADVSVAAQISKIRASAAQVLLVGTAGLPAGTVFHGVTDAGLNIPVVTGNGNASQAFMKQYAAILPKELYVESTHCLAPSAITDRAEKAAFDAYTTAMTTRGVAVDCLQALGWDPALILTSALRRVGTNATAEQLRAYLAGMKIAGVNGTYDFKRVPQRGLDERNVVMIRWNEAKSTWIPASKPGGTPL